MTVQAHCTCGYPKVVARNMNGHANDCPVYIAWAKEFYKKDTDIEPLKIRDAPHNCDHRYMFVSVRRVTTASDEHLSYEEHVQLCQKCGQFHIALFKYGNCHITTFRLPTPELVEAAGRYYRMLNEG